MKNQEQNEELSTEKKHNYFYKITNLINGKFYYGIRSTNKEIEDDCYFGSGTAIRNAVRKYGKENFNKEIIADYPTRREVSNHEKVIVTLELIQLEECYNCKTGGDNGFTRIMSDEEKQYRREVMPRGDTHHTFGKEMPKETRQQISQTLTGMMVGEKHWSFLKPYPESGKKKISEFNLGKTYTKEYKENMSEKLSGLVVGENHAFFGKHHSVNTKEKISKTLKERKGKSLLHIESGLIFVTHKDAAKHFEVSVWSISSWISKGRFKMIDKIII